MCWLMRIASVVPAGTLTLTGGALFEIGCPSGVTTGLVAFGFGPGGAGVICVVTCCVCPDTGGVTVIVSVSPFESMYCTCCATPVEAACALAWSIAWSVLLLHPASSARAIRPATPAKPILRKFFAFIVLLLAYLAAAHLLFRFAGRIGPENCGNKGCDALAVGVRCLRRRKGLAFGLYESSGSRTQHSPPT